jgi:WD40 repeat protein
MSRGGAGSNRVECWDIRPDGSFVPAWSIRDGQPISPDEPYLLNQATWFTNGVSIHYDGKTVATAESRLAGSSGARPLVALRDGDTGRAVAELGQSETSFDTRLAVAPDGQTLFAWDDRMLERWDLAAGRLAGRVRSPGRAYFRGLAVHPSGRAVLTASGDGKARYWDPVDLAPMRALKLGVGRLHSVAISPDGALAAAGGDKGQVVIWNLDV